MNAEPTQARSQHIGISKVESYSILPSPGNATTSLSESPHPTDSLFNYPENRDTTGSKHSIPNTPLGDGDDTGDTIRKVRAKLELLTLAGGHDTLPDGDSHTKQDITPTPSASSSPGKFGSLTRRFSPRVSRMSSRSPSPTKTTTKPEGHDDTKLLRRRTLLGGLKNPFTESSASVTDLPRTIETVSAKSSKTNMRHDHNDLRTLTSLVKSLSSDRISALHNDSTGDQSRSTSRRASIGLRRSTLISPVISKRRDELWAIYRTLDADYSKFSAKSSHFKAGVVRQCLLPFLNSNADKSSWEGIQLEDLERRINILSKWWSGLLDLISGKYNQSLSGTDRPTILDALTGLMERPEWRLCTKRAISEGGTDTLLPPDKLSRSLGPTRSDCIEGSILQNLCNMYAQHLSAQMVFAVEKMSFRNASTTLITFCGKAIAFAVLHCPGIGAILFKQWNIDRDVFRRILAENGVEKFDKLDCISNMISKNFPAHLSCLAFTSFPRFKQCLNKQSYPGPEAYRLDFYGHWSDRWHGRESDLFYIFVRQFLILTHDYLPENHSDKQRIVAPGMLFVQAQVLVNLDATVYRNTTATNEQQFGGMTAYDEFLAGPDTVVASLPLLPLNSSRIMAQNRLIMLFKDTLARHRVALSDHLRAFFASTFMHILHACTISTSMYNQTACFTLCAFLEEAIVIFLSYELGSQLPINIVDGPFWTSVFSKMLQSQNTVTIIRVYALLFSIWPSFAADASRKEELALRLVLSEQIFNQGFMHWCPLVRAYYMRLICWRCGRFIVNRSSLDDRIIRTLYERLHATWTVEVASPNISGYDGQQPVNLVFPCLPVPGRRYLIVKTETPPNSTLLLSAFDDSLPSSPVGATSREKALIWTSPGTLATQVEEAGQESGSSLRGLFRGIMGSTRKHLDPGTTTRTQVESPDLDIPIGDQSSAEKWTQLDDPSIKSHHLNEMPIQCFKFSLEHIGKAGSNKRGFNLRFLAPRLPVAAQKWLDLSPQPIQTGQIRQIRGERGIYRKYACCALAEWMLVVTECQNFIDRRKHDGVLYDEQVETPSLQVEPFKKSNSHQLS